MRALTVALLLVLAALIWSALALAMEYWSLLDRQRRADPELRRLHGSYHIERLYTRRKIGWRIAWIAATGLIATLYECV